MNIELENYKRLLAVASNQKLRPDLGVFYFHGERVQATNAQVWLDCDSGGLSGLSGRTLPAAETMRALDVLNLNKINLEKTGDNSVTFTDGNYSIKIPASDGKDFPEKPPREIDPALLFAKDPLPTILKAAGFLDSDASAAFLHSIYVSAGRCFCMRNDSGVVFNMQDCFSGSEPFNFKLHHTAFQALNSQCELLSVSQDEGGAYIFLADGSWIYSLCSEAAPPEQFQERFLDVEKKTLPLVPEGFAAAVNNLDQLSLLSLDYKHMINLGEDGLSTCEGDFFAKAAIGSFTPTSRFNGAVLRQLCAVADRFDFSQYPGPVPFQSSDKQVFGLVMGVAI